MIDKTKPIPLYFQLKNYYLDKIENGIYKPGSMIPSETEIQKQFGVSRITVRRALMELENEGYLEKKPGIGTFITERKKNDKVTQALDNISTWTETMQEKGITPGTSRSEITEVSPPPDVALFLKIDFSDKVIRIKRWRTGDGKPFCIMTNYILSSMVPGIVEDGLDQESLYKVYEEKYGIKFGIAREIVEARGANLEESEYLKVAEGSPVLLVTRISYDTDGNPFEVVKQTTRADSYKYHVTLKGRKNK